MILQCLEELVEVLLRFVYYEWSECRHMMSQAILQYASTNLTPAWLLDSFSDALWNIVLEKLILMLKYVGMVKARLKNSSPLVCKSFVFHVKKYLPKSQQLWFRLLGCCKDSNPVRFKSEFFSGFIFTAAQVVYITCDDQSCLYIFLRVQIKYTIFHIFT